MMDGKTGEKQHESSKIVDDYGIRFYFLTAAFEPPSIF
jgi:hypothetical protein